MSEANVNQVREILDKLFAREKLFPTEKSILAEWFISGALKVDRHVEITGDVKYSNIITGDGNEVIYKVEGLAPETVNTKIEQSYESILDMMIGISGLEKILQSEDKETEDIFNYHNKWCEADEKTQAIMVKIADRDFGNNLWGAYLKEEDFIHSSLIFPYNQLKKIDELWKEYSNERFGFSVQCKIWKEVNGNFKEFGIRVGWRKKYFPGWNVLPFHWIYQDSINYSLSAPYGHLPVWCYWNGAVAEQGAAATAHPVVPSPIMIFGNLEERISRFFSYLEKDCKALLN